MDESDGILFTMNRLKREVEKSIEKIRDMARKWKEFFFPRKLYHVHVKENKINI